MMAPLRVTARNGAPPAGSTGPARWRPGEVRSEGWGSPDGRTFPSR